ncbi:MAG: rhamnogalacturonan acetylesterase [Betaproteobacteria bacterium]|nr:rhamnogalacturonan acetylesterase [Betaproteobacteria bacterium]
MNRRNLLCAAAAITVTSCSTAGNHSQTELPRVRVILVGDSTIATRTGYGDALCGMFRANVSCINLARGGRSSGSFRAEGLWDQMMARLAGPEKFASTYVLIQFGHNDQPGKPGRSTDLATEFPVNMARYVAEVKQAGAVPVLVTPLTRRTFRDGVLRNDLEPWADATRRVAQTSKTALLDLNADSAAAVSAMGSAEADTLAEEPPPAKPVSSPATTQDNAKAEPNGAPKSRFDYTHLGAKGATLFARMVTREIAQAVPALAAHVDSSKGTAR